MELLKLELILMFLGGQDIKILLHYNSIDIIDVNEGSQVGSKEQINQFEIS